MDYRPSILCARPKVPSKYACETQTVAQQLPRVGNRIIIARVCFSPPGIQTGTAVSAPGFCQFESECRCRLLPVTSIQRRSAVFTPVFAGLALNTGWPSRQNRIRE